MFIVEVCSSVCCGGEVMTRDEKIFYVVYCFGLFGLGVVPFAIGIYIYFASCP
jgi:hypothetical protein